MSRRASYREAVRWIVANDDTSWNDDYGARPHNEGDHLEALSGMISVTLVADLFRKPAASVALDVLRERRRQGQADAAH